jgi:hypothetical protein
VVFGVFDDPVGGHRFQRRQDLACALLAPGFGEKATDFVATRIEHDRETS